MPRRPSSYAFFSAMPVFDRAAFARAMGRDPADRAVTSLLSHHLRGGSIRRIARSVFASVPPNGNPGTWMLDRFLAASRLRAGAVIGYRSALELHGCAHAEAGEVQLISAGEPGILETAEFACRFVRSARHLSPPDGTMTVTRQGLPVNVTTLERTVVDLFDRYDLAGGVEELFQSLEIVATLDAGLDLDALVGFARMLGNAAAAGALGYWLECERDRLRVTSEALEDIRSLAPRQSRYALGAAPGCGRAATGWNVILPHDIVESHFDD